MRASVVILLACVFLMSVLTVQARHRRHRARQSHGSHNHGDDGSHQHYHGVCRNKIKSISEKLKLHVQPKFEEVVQCLEDTKANLKKIKECQTPSP